MKSSYKSKVRGVCDIFLEAEKVLITVHINPDGDAIGSALALSDALERIGKRTSIFVPQMTEVPPQYLFMPGVEKLEGKMPDNGQEDVFVVVDCASIKRIEGIDNRFKKARVTVNIDHHTDNSLFADYNLVMPEYSATSELILDIVDGLDIEIDSSMAMNIFTGIYTDTGGFKFQNTNRASIEKACRMMDEGASLSVVAENVYSNWSRGFFELLKRVMNGAVIIDDKQLIYGIIRKIDLEETGTIRSETEQIINMLRSYGKSRIVAVFYEDERHKTRVSLRGKRGFRVLEIAAHFGGGGHPCAAGFSLDKPIDEVVEIFIDHLDRKYA